MDLNNRVKSTGLSLLLAIVVFVMVCMLREHRTLLPNIAIFTQEEKIQQKTLLVTSAVNNSNDQSTTITGSQHYYNAQNNNNNNNTNLTAENYSQETKKEEESSNNNDDDDEDIIGKMIKNGLFLSAKQQSCFQARRHLVVDYFPKLMRYSVFTSGAGAVVLNDDFAYRHVWKNAGTTMEIQTGEKQRYLTNPIIFNRKWMTFVRDPIDHFLSGWAEVLGARLNVSDDRPYDVRVREWLDETQQTVLCERKQKHPPRGCRAIRRHSMPQANYFFNQQGAVYEQMEFIGDIQELPNVLEQLLNFPFNTSLQGGRVAANTPFVKEHYPRRPDWLSNETLQAICDFVAIDYFLFDYEPPDACTHIRSKSFFTPPNSLKA